ncbi:MAG: EamA family transporter [Bacteroidota bacterium]
MNKTVLFVIPATIWGSTWFVITFQLGEVDPLLSVSYRFLLSGMVLLAYCFLKKLPLSFNRGQHVFIALQGALLFGCNYWLVYISETYINSALVAITFSTLIFMNIVFNSLILKNPIKKKVSLGAVLGVSGTVMIFQQELQSLTFEDETFVGLLICLSGVLSASLGNITSASNQKRNLPVIQTNAFGMLYGGLIMMMIALIMGKPLEFDYSIGYVSSLFYLSLFGSVIAFSTYLTLIGKIGADKGAYVIVVVPIIALVISTIFEGYQITLPAIGGMLLIVVGNLLALGKKKTA